MNHWKHTFFKAGRMGPLSVRGKGGGRPLFQKARGGAFAFMPGLFLILLGLVTVLAPRLILAIAASFLVFLGILLCVVTWKALTLKRRFEDFAKRVQADAESAANSSGGESGYWDANQERYVREKWEEPEDRDEKTTVRIIYH